VLALVDQRAPPLGDLPLVCIDGPAGAGKTTLADAVATARGLSVVHLDDLYPGWGGLDGFEPLARAVLEDLAAGRPASYPRYDWHIGEYAEHVGVSPDRGLVLEGVGAGNRGLAASATVLAWVEADPAVCDARWEARDGKLMRRYAAAWRRDEARLFAREHTRERADLVLRT
jgi:uridine kinase